MACTLVLLRHGESLWNRARRFAGWSDVPLSPRGVEEARQAGDWLAERGVRFDRCFTSCLTRAIDTARLALAAVAGSGVPTTRAWQLNERHYGAAQGMTWWQAALRFGPLRVIGWRRDPDTAPPPLSADDPRHPARDPGYAGVAAEFLPATETLNQLRARVLPFWTDEVAPQLRAGRNVLLVAHRNVLRALARVLAADAPVAAAVRFRTGQAVLFELDESLAVKRCVVAGASAHWQRPTL